MFEDLFATPIYSEILTDDEISKEIGSIIDDVKFNLKEEWSQTHYLSTDFAPDSSCNILDEFNLVQLKKSIHHHLLHYLEVLNYPIINLKYETESWISLFKKGNYAHIHSHGTADISGVYYYKTNEKDGDIFFESPFPQLKQSKIFYNHSVSWPHTPKKDKLIIFPGWLSHGVRTNTTEHDRISISFNIRIK
tara:strand:- start:763 stop:1338 length:576 start_codon:yes stop_codon:yes gene_type:complete